ncbi:MAG: thiamine-phosphate kinase [Acidobacteriota bacterium]|nr:thiamine-phosphate kinase [Acidobacteriota bacterium]
MTQTDGYPAGTSPVAAGDRVADVGERALIARILDRLPASPDWVVVGPGDDAAVLEPARNRLEVLSCDALVEGVHFDRAFVAPADIGHRALAVNLSDLAAMGAEPRAALLSLALPATLPLSDVDALVDGLLALAARHRVHLVGGNITRSPGPLVADVTVIGSAGRRRVLRRAGAQPGDEVYLSGEIGAAVVGLESLRAGVAGEPGEGPDGLAACQARYRRPEPRVRLGLLLARNRAATACMDLSDGLADAATQVAQASGTGMVLDAAAGPVHAAARRWFERQAVDPLRAALSGGDDYELLFTVRPRLRRRLGAARRQAGELRLTRVGVVTAEPAVRVRHEDGREEPVPAGFAHFR